MTKTEIPVDTLRGYKKLTDQMISQHAYLRDYYGFRSSALDILLLVLSASLVAITFADVKTVFGTDIELKPYVGLISISVFLTSVISWKVDWKGREVSYGDAVNLLSKHKRDIFALLDTPDKVDAETVMEVNKDYDLVSEKCTKIPEKFFLRTKQYHKRKVALSKELDEEYFSAIWVLRVKLWWRHTIK